MVSQCIHIENRSVNSWYHSVFTLNTTRDTFHYFATKEFFPNFWCYCKYNFQEMTIQKLHLVVAESNSAFVLRFTPLRSGGGSTSILINNENLGVELDSDSPHQSDIVLLDSNEIKELRNDDQWNEVFNMQVLSQDETVVKPLIGEETRELLSYNQLLEQARAITDLEKINR
ncbi:hypothetical protein OUZ56_021564 [Daphnia magna]|uniref:Uncharacterized protein n=1 Tax=Daphnia magna TaxID=35525 RepID=A0ABR0AU22_9CRUS|nr:hypothetical protein OUZ56_021564 [Daphnia magna]